MRGIDDAMADFTTSDFYCTIISAKSTMQEG